MHTDNPMAKHDDAPGSEAPSSSNGRIPVIKIKIPKKVEDQETEAAAEEEVKTHCCKECNKSFSSGKALGGHMSSAHVQANKDYSFKKLSSKKKAPCSNSGSEGGKFPCNLCDKSFLTKKSIFGHMRCHPERYWRGMVPPPETTKTAEASSEDGGSGDGDGDGPVGEHDQIDSGLGFNLKGWALSNKRGRGPVINPAFRAGDEEKDNESFVAGHQLIRMLKGECSTRRKPEPVSDNSFQEGKGKDKVENQDSESPTSGPRNDTNDELYNTAIQVLVSVKMDTQKRAAAAVETDTTSSSPEKYKCNVCGRLFPTHQALGGHRSSHNKFKMSIINYNSSSSLPIAKKKRNSDSFNSNKKKKSCNDVADAGTASATATAAASSSSPAITYAFDLNMMPEEEMEDVGGGSSNQTSGCKHS